MMLGWLARKILRRWPLLAACVLASLSLGIHADDAPGFRRRLWTTEAGTPADIWAMAQGKDGYLWLGTGSGLYRFDGVRFERFVPPAGERFPSNDITALSMLADGSLWIGYYYGGASLLAGGHLHHYPATAPGFPGGMVLAFSRTADGAVWAATEGGLARFDGKQWRTIDKSWNYPTQRADWLITDSNGTLWVTTGESLVFLRAGAQHFERTDQAVAKYGVVAQAPDGTLWLSDHAHGTRALPGLTADHPAVLPSAVPGNADFVWSYRLLFDRYGNLWGTCVDKGGIYRVASLKPLDTGRSVRAQDLTETVDRSRGLISDRAVPLLEDAEGTIWAGTNMGLVSFHRNSFQVPPQVPQGTASNYGMAVDGHGDAWVANNGVLLRFDGDGGEVVRRDLADINAMLFNSSGDLWMVGRNELFWLRGNALHDVPFPVSPSITKVNALAFDQSGQPWLALAERGLFHRQDGQWRSVTPLPAMPNESPTALASDDSGALWVGYADNRIVRLVGNRAQLYTAKDGLHVGTVTTIRVGATDVLIGGEQGLARWQDDRIESINVADNEAFSGITGILRTDDHQLWLNTGKGVMRLDAREAATSFAQPDHQPAYRLFDFRDGLPGIAVQASPVPTAFLDGHRRLWFLTNQGPAWTRTDALSNNAVPPPVAIQAIFANGTRYIATSHVRLPKGTTNLQVQYTAASLAVPDRVRFRYRLDGIDKDWQDAGNRREAFYSNLAPGTYAFRVIAANDDGVWNPLGAQTRITIEPWFFQSLWFYALLLLIAVSLVVMLFVWRTRLAAERVHLQLMERMSERERIAREIHDTLLQAVQGLLLRLQALLSSPCTGQQRADALRTAVEQARSMVIEGRDRIIALRGESVEYTQLHQSLLAVGEDLASLYPATAFHITTEGKPRNILPSAFDEILDIAREAIRNAFLHAGATHVETHVAYTKRALQIRVADNGRGFDERTAKAAADTGHWGIVGMHERAERLGAKLVRQTVKPHGTEWLLRVPCRAAYRADLRDTPVRGAAPSHLASFSINLSTRLGGTSS